MKFYNFHIGDFNAATRHLTHLERAFYRDLIDMYYDTEQPITGDLAYLHRRLAIRSDDEKHALQNVLDEFFTIKHGKYRHARIDREIKNYQHRNGSNERNEKSNESNAQSNGKSNAKSNAKPLSNAERQARHRQRVKMVQSLINKGVKIPLKATFETILALFNGNVRNANRNEKSNESNGKNNAITNNQEIYIASYEQDKNFEKNSPKTSQTATAPKTPQPNFAFSQSQQDACKAKGMNIDETFTKFSQFYTAKGFNCTQTAWVRMFDNWIAQERLPSQLPPSPSTGSQTPTGESYGDYLARILSENASYNRTHGLGRA